jgi:hypothetical protein
MKKPSELSQPEMRVIVSAGIMATVSLILVTGFSKAVSQLVKQYLTMYYLLPLNNSIMAQISRVLLSTRIIT